MDAVDRGKAKTHLTQFSCTWLSTSNLPSTRAESTLSNTLCSRIAFNATGEVFAEDGSETIDACEFGWTTGADFGEVWGEGDVGASDDSWAVFDGKQRFGNRVHAGK